MRAAIITSQDTSPFVVSTRPKAGAPGLYEMMVGQGYLLKSLKPSDILTIPNLKTWLPFIANDVIWIYLTIAAGVVTAATIQSYGNGNAGFNPTLNVWDNTGGYVQDDGTTPPSGPNQIALNILIATGSTDAVPIVNQKVNTNLLLVNDCISGKAAIVATPSPYGGYP